MKNLLGKLNPEQKEAVMHTNGPLLVLAGAGSGKTRVITNRIGYLIKNKICLPQNILAITFTNKAANEMKNRVGELVGKAAQDMTICTSHSFGAKVLREYQEKIGSNKTFKILSERHKFVMLKSKIRQVTPRYKSIDVFWLSSRISLAKNGGIFPADMPDDTEKGPLIKSVYELYEKELKKIGAIDFDDLLIKPLILMKKDKVFLEFLRKRYKFISVDEYQDINKIQFELIRLLSHPNNNICAVGDDDQGIYGWRGADISNILSFKNTYSKTKLIKLERNYRSTNNILLAANAVIEKNKKRTPKKMWSDKVGGRALEHYVGDDELDEVEWICREIKKLNREGIGYKNIAILYRRNAQSRLYEEELRRSLIPYQVAKGAGFYDAKEIVDILAYLNFINDTKDELSLERIIKVPNWHISKDTLESLYGYAIAKKCDVWQAFKDSSKIRLRADQQENVTQFTDLIEEYIQKFKKGSLSKTVDEMINQIKYRDYLNKMIKVNKENRLLRIDELVHGIELFEKSSKKTSLASYLHQLAIMINEKETKENKSSVSLLTVHSSKGMEFDVVFLVGLDDEVIPSKRSLEEGGIEEERRLFYVAITRARSLLYLTWPGTKTLYNKSKKVKMCRFIRDIPSDLLAAPIGAREKEDREKFMTDFFSKMKERFK